MRLLLFIVRFGIVLTTACVLLGAIVVIGAYLYLAPALPSVVALKDIQLQTPLRVFAQGGELIAVFGEKLRKPLAIDEVPVLMQKAFLAAEDDRFFQHPGVDYQGILRAAWHLLRTGEKEQGGSTITMQLARNFFLNNERSYERKLREVFLAVGMEQELSKREILELYLNKIYLGNRAYGVGAAAEVYYGLEARRLTLSQIAMIAGLPKAPSRYNPIADPKRALERRNYVLERMRQLDFINEKAYRAALRKPVRERVHAPDIAVSAPFVAEMVRAQMVERFGDEAYTGGYKVYTTVDAKLQRAATASLRRGLIAYDKRHGYRGAEGTIGDQAVSAEMTCDSALANYNIVGGLHPALVLKVQGQEALVCLREGRRVQLDWEDLSWARPYIDENAQGPPPNAAADILAQGDIVRVAQDDDHGWRLGQVPDVAGALVSLDPNEGAIRALVGGFDFTHSNFNRAIHAHRQPGSAFKPFIYSAALEHGFTPASIINDAPVVFEAPGIDSMWRPENYGGRFYGPTRMRVALAESRNLVSIRLLSSIGLAAAMKHIVKFGFDARRLPSDLSLALGSGSVSPLELAAGFAVFANGGYRIEPHLIERINTIGGQVVYEAEPRLACHAACRQGKTLSIAGRTTAALSRGKDATADPASGPKPHDNLRSDSAADVYKPRQARRVLPPANAYQMVSMMKDVIRSGTGVKAMALDRGDLAGKTGTTNDHRDAWFSGYNADMVTAVWVGFDTPRSLGEHEVGAVAALPIWIDYMRVALKDRPESSMPQPNGMITVRIDPQTGLVASADSQDGIFETFRADQVPKSSAMQPQRVSERPYQQQPVEIPEQLF